MDRTTKILLAAIALGLWVNGAALLGGTATAQAPPQGPPRQQSPPPRPQPPPHDTDLSDIERHLLDMQGSLLNIERILLSISEGGCRNRKLCGI
jgi:hypothetical protein